MPVLSVNFIILCSAVMLGGGIGAALRYITTGYLVTQTIFPWGTLTVNLLGSFGAGLAFAFFREGEMAKWLQLLVITGFMGGFTTFSAFALEVLLLLEKGDIFIALFYATASFFGSVLLAAGGFFALRFFL